MICELYAEKVWVYARHIIIPNILLFKHIWAKELDGSFKRFVHTMQEPQVMLDRIEKFISIIIEGHRRKLAKSQVQAPYDTASG